jgi:hypothetical protein
MIRLRLNVFRSSKFLSETKVIRRSFTCSKKNIGEGQSSNFQNPQIRQFAIHHQVI